MNSVILIGRLTKDCDVRISDGGVTILRNSIAVDRRLKKEGESSVDFINILAFGKTAEFLNTYFKKGNKLALTGRIQTGNYTNKDGVKVYTFEILVENVEFVESLASKEQNTTPQSQQSPDGFVNILDGIDEELPFNN